MKRRYFILATFIIASFVGFKIYRSRNGAIEIETVQVERKDIIKSITASGEIDSEEKAELKFEAAGKVVWLPVEVGEGVEKGQALASIDIRTLKESLQQARANLDKYLESQRQFREAHKYDSPGDELFAQFAQYDAQVRTAESQLEQAQIALNKATLISPITGTVTKINIKEGQVYSASSGPAVVVANLSPNHLYFKAEIDEEDLYQAQIGQEAEITLEAADNKIFEGSVREIAPQTNLSSAGDIIIEAEIQLYNSLPKNLRVLGLSGDAELITESRRSTLVLPLEAVTEDGGTNCVWKIEAGSALRVEVKLGLESEFEVEILSGVGEGDIVSTDNFDLLEEGQRVRTGRIDPRQAPGQPPARGGGFFHRIFRRK